MASRSTRARGHEAAALDHTMNVIVHGGKGKENHGFGAGKVPTTTTAHGHATTTAPVRLPIPRSQVTLPLELTTLVECRYRDGKSYQARIIERRPIEGKTITTAGPEDWDYYVHYRNFNRRMDEWVELDALNLDTVIPPDYDVNDPKNKKRRMDEEEHSEEEGEGHEDFDPQQLRDHVAFTKVKNVDKMELGRYEMETWYFSPLPNNLTAKTLYVCEYDLAFFKRRIEMLRHLKKVRILHPPGTEIYRHNGISMFEVDGSTAKTYCQNLCYLAKLFLDHKSLNNDTDLFLFYVMCECDERGAHMVGYFSKEKSASADLNLACILTFPCYQRRGYGKFLISFSYELSKIEQKVGTPERPLSDLGLVSYRGYWTRVLLNILKDKEGFISVKELSDMTMIRPADIISTLQFLNMIQYHKGQHVICAAPHVIEAHLKKCGSAGLVVEPSKIVWSPFVDTS